MHTLFVTRFTLLLGARAAILMQSCGQNIEKSWILPYNSADFHSVLQQALRRYPHYPLKIVVDRVGLDVRRDALPPVSFMARQPLLQRQAAHHFPDALLRGSMSIKQENKSYQGLHAACPDETALRGYFEQINTLPNPMEPLRLFPLEWASYAAQVSLLPQKGWVFANILTESLGLRQILLHDGVPVFTRLHEDSYPSLAQPVLQTRIAAHIRSTRHYLPRLNAAIPADMPARLYVPAFLKDFAEYKELQELQVQIYALEAPHASMVPPEWSADIAWMSTAARQKHAVLPIHPQWLKERRDSVMKRQIALWALIGFGSAGIYSGMTMLVNVGHKEPPLMAAEPIAAAKAFEPPPQLNLEAVLYNGPQDWAVWINGEKRMPGDDSGAYKIVDVTPAEVRVQLLNQHEETVLNLHKDTGAISP
jgi:hypothetical protein